MNDTKRPTIIDVARSAGVGASTVSRHVRGGQSVSPAVAKRIGIAIAELGYEPNALARSLRVGRSQTLGVLFPHVNNIFFGNAIHTIQNEARRSGFTVMLLMHQEDPKLQQEQLASLKRSQVDGIILVPAADTNAAQVKTLLGSIPMVCFDRPLGSSIDCVMLDNFAAGQQSTEHLLFHKHSHILSVTAPHKLFPLQSRVKGHVNAMEGAGLQVETILWRNSDQLKNDLVHAIQRKKAPVTAILSMSYSITIAILGALHDLNIRLSDLGFVGIDELEFASFVRPSITTIAQPAERFARLAVEQLLKRTAGSTAAASHISLAGNMVVRASCGCKRAASKRF
jgi:LacI family transcriptional regulator